MKLNKETQRARSKDVRCRLGPGSERADIAPKTKVAVPEARPKASSRATPIGQRAQGPIKDGIVDHGPGEDDVGQQRAVYSRPG